MATGNGSGGTPTIAYHATPFSGAFTQQQLMSPTTVAANTQTYFYPLYFQQVGGGVGGLDQVSIRGQSQSGNQYDTGLLSGSVSVSAGGIASIPARLTSPGSSADVGLRINGGSYPGAYLLFPGESIIITGSVTGGGTVYIHYARLDITSG